MRLWLVLPLLSFVLLISIWAGRTQIAETTVGLAASGLGLTNLKSEISQLDLSQSHFRQLEFIYSSNMGEFKVKASDINITYKPEELLHRKIDLLTIDKLVFQHISNINPSGTSQHNQKNIQPDKLLKQIKHSLNNFLFYDTISVKNLFIHSDVNSLLNDKPLHFTSYTKGKNLYSTLSLQHLTKSFDKINSQPLLTLKLSEDTFNIELYSFIHDNNNALKLNVDISATKITADYMLNISQLNAWTSPFIDLSTLKGTDTIHGKISLNTTENNKSSGILQPTITVNTERLHLNTYQLEDVSLTLYLAYKKPDAYHNLQFLTGSNITASKFSGDKYSITNSQIEITGTLTDKHKNWSYNSKISCDNLLLNYNSQFIKFNNITVKLKNELHKLDIDGIFSAANIPGEFSFILENDFKLQKGKFEITPLSPLNLDDNEHKFSQLVSPWPFEFDLLTGSILMSSISTWSHDKPFKMISDVKFENVGGTLANDIVFSGLNFDHNFSVYPDINSAEAFTITLEQLDSGITVSNISTQLKFQTENSSDMPILHLQRLSGDIFGGNFSSANLIYDLNKEINHLKINAKNIDLAEIIKTQQFKDIDITGKIDGTIPVDITEQGISVENGVFINAVRSGTIRYNPGAAAEELSKNPLTGVALDTLKDFRYSYLSAGVKFTPDGVLTVNLKLKGTSPELETTRPVHLNINTEQNLISLLKSLRLAEGVSEDIDNKVRKQYEKNIHNN